MTTTPPPVRRVRAWDVVLTIVLLVLIAPFAYLMSAASLFFGMAGDFCSEATCNFGLMNVAFQIGLIGPWVVVLAALAFSVVRLVLRRRAFWVPLAGAAAIVVVWLGAFGLLWLSTLSRG
jgi:hypothetical protein